MKKEYDIVIVGAGPAGTSCAINLASSNLNILIADKSLFPRDKICGGGLSERSINVLKRMPDDIFNKLVSSDNIVISKGARFISPNSMFYDVIPDNNEINGIVCNRKEFDNYLLDNALKYQNINYLNGKLENIIFKDEYFELEFDKCIIKSKFVVGADGANSLVSNKLTDNFKIKKNKIVALRAIFENITGFDERNLIELHFLKEIIPGYFWIFPMGDNKFNVGIGSSKILLKRKKIILKKLFFEAINNNKSINYRFANAKQLSRVEADILPAGGFKNKISGNSFLLIGDAAALVDPFTGEGIGNALLSGEIAAKAIIQAFKEGNFTEKYLFDNYNRLIKKKLNFEFFIHKCFLIFTKKESLVNFFMKKANNSIYFRKAIIKMTNHSKHKIMLFNPLFYFKLFFNK